MRKKYFVMNDELIEQSNKKQYYLLSNIDCSYCLFRSEGCLESSEV